MPKTYHYAFKNTYLGLSKRLTTSVEIISISGIGNNRITVNALWDTGATSSAVTPDVARRLSLVPIGRTKVNGVNNVSMADIVLLSVGLPNQTIIRDVHAAVCNLVKDVDLLIGMDIITTGDFCISNGEGKTLFSFAIPPFVNKTDLYEKALAVNNRNK